MRSLTYSLLAIGSITILISFIPLIISYDLSSFSRSLFVSNDEEKSKENDVCLTFPKVHDANKDFEGERYTNKVQFLIDKMKVYDRELPSIEVLGDGARFAIWGPTFPPQASAWEVKNGEINIIQGPGWVLPHGQDYHPRHFIHRGRGSFIGFSSIFPNNYGHLIHDHLPVIAWLMTVVHPTTKFILHYDSSRPVMKDLLNAIDPNFVTDRVVWIPANHVFQVVSGELLIMVPDQIPTNMNTAFMKPLQKWLAKTYPGNFADSSIVDPDDKLVIFYSRGNSSDVKHGRKIEPNHEQQIIHHIEDAMIRHGRKERLHVFNGMSGDTPLSISDQRLLFHSATTVIGPHGSGLANMIWLDLEQAGASCEGRPQVLEFITGPASGNVQYGEKFGPYLGYNIIFRGLPIDYHSILYTAQSTSEITYIDLESLDLALDNMWDKSVGV